MKEPSVEIREYVYTELVYLDEDGFVVTRERQSDDYWQDTLSTREWTDDELADYGYLLENP